MIKASITTVLTLFVCLLFYTSNLQAKDPARVIAGWVEKVRVNNYDFAVKAKLDTGARTSSIHAKNIKSFKKDGERWVKFTLVLKDNKDNLHEIEIEKPRSRRTNIKNHDGEHDKRHVVDLEVCFNGKKYNTEFTLADRREYIYDILLGRQFLKKVAIVDPKSIFLTTAECK
ncbi:MAG: ATP-dependent zinc protease [Pseudomonadota bacterium]